MSPLDDDDLSGGRHSRDPNRKEGYEKLAEKSKTTKTFRRTSFLERPGDPPEVSFEEDIVVLARPAPGKRMNRTFDKWIDGMLDSMSKSMIPLVKSHVKHAIDISFAEMGQPQHVVDLSMGAIKIEKDNIVELYNTLHNFGGNLTKGTGDAAGGYLFDTMTNGLDTVSRELFKDIGASAAQFMRKAAYRLPSELVGGPKLRHVPTSPSEWRKMTAGQYLKSWLVSRGEGYNVKIFRTGHLQRSIGYKITMDPDMPGKLVSKKKFERQLEKLPEFVARKARVTRADYEARRKQAIKVVIGPGASGTPAPHYAKAVNEGKGPAPGIHFVTKNRKGMPGMYKGGTWAGFVGKRYLERTAEFLVRETPKFKAKAEHIMRAQIRAARRNVTVSEGIYQAVAQDVLGRSEDELVRMASMRTQKLLNLLEGELLAAGEPEAK